MVGSDGAAHVSKPARVPPAAAWVGTGDGLLASTGPVGFGVGLGLGFGAGVCLGLGAEVRLGFGAEVRLSLDAGLGVNLEADGEDAGVLGGVSQDAPGPVRAPALGQAGFLAVARAA